MNNISPSFKTFYFFFFQFKSIVLVGFFLSFNMILLFLDDNFLVISVGVFALKRVVRASPINYLSSHSYILWLKIRKILLQQTPYLALYFGEPTFGSLHVARRRENLARMREKKEEREIETFGRLVGLGSTFFK
ncbi:unnamed protein product [Prunus armeniaca]